jgi:hypothetical protein
VCVCVCVCVCVRLEIDAVGKKTMWFLHGTASFIRNHLIYVPGQWQTLHAHAVCS